MIRHIVLLDWKAPISDAQLSKVNAAMAQLPEQVPGIVSIAYGADQDIFPGNANYVLMLDFANEDDFKAYVAHPAHQALLADVTGPLLESWKTAQIAL